MCPKVNNMFFLFLLIIVLLSVLWVRKYLRRYQTYWQTRNVPFVDTTKFCSMWDRLSLKYGFDQTEQIVYNGVKEAGISTYAGMLELGNPIFYVVDPDLIKTVLIKDFDSFTDRRVFASEKTDPLFAKMIFNTKGQFWKDLRATISPTFSTGKIRRMYSIFNHSSEKLADFLRRQIQNSEELNLQDAFGRYTMDVIASAAFGLDSQGFETNESEFGKFAKRFQNQFTGIRVLRFIISFFMSPKLLAFFGISLMDHGAITFFSQVIKDTIRDREQSGVTRQDFLQLLMESRNSNSSVDGAISKEEPSDELTLLESEAQISSTHSKIQLTEELILAQCLLFFNAGFDGIETMLLMAAYELAINDDVQEKLYQELREAVQANGGQLTYDLIMKLDYLDQVTSETLRKWPQGIRAERKSTKEYQIPNTDITLEKDTSLVIPIYGIHRDERHYPEPEKFMPERFTAANKANRNPYTYLPFGAGPRNCIAMRFALAEGKAAIAHLILNFKLEPSVKTEIPLKFKAGISVFKPANGLWLRVSLRK